MAIEKMKNSKKTKKTDEQRWAEASLLFESDEHLESLGNSVSITSQEHRSILKAGSKKATSKIDSQNDLDCEKQR